MAGVLCLKKELYTNNFQTEDSGGFDKELNIWKLELNKKYATPYCVNT
ncbi:MAG: hypothetical protein LBH18_05055 [Spirochaetaceae bacterium]|nr:hypothetical protein [Spirochaetaceae bacterium]